MRRRRFWLLRLLMGLTFASGYKIVVHGQEVPLTEYQLKAVFIYNFAEFIEWPTAAFSDAKAPFVVGVIGDNPFDAYLEETVKSKFMNEHPFAVRHIRVLADARKCHILFVADSERKRLPEILNAIRDV